MHIPKSPTSPMFVKFPAFFPRSRVTSSVVFPAMHTGARCFRCFFPVSRKKRRNFSRAHMTIRKISTFSSSTLEKACLSSQNNYVHVQAWNQECLILAKFLYFAFQCTKAKSRSLTTQKRTRTISSQLDQASLVNKGFNIWLRTELFIAEPKQEILRGQGNRTQHSLHFALWQFQPHNKERSRLLL